MTDKERMKLSDLNDRHLGETVYIIGCAPTLNKLTDKEISFLNDSVTIGVNFSHLKIRLKYWIGGHIEQTAFALESNLPEDVPIIASADHRMAHIHQVWDNLRVVPMNDVDPMLPLSRHVDQNQSLYGATSIILSATHLAYIMGAKKIVYLGFEGENSLHFYTDDEKLRVSTINKIEEILDSKKYYSEVNYDLPQYGVNPFLNIHRAFDYMMNEDVPNCHFAPRELLEKNNLNYFEKDSKNRKDIENYILFLNERGVSTLALAREKMVVKAGCAIIEDLTTD